MELAEISSLKVTNGKEKRKVLGTIPRRLLQEWEWGIWEGRNRPLLAPQPVASYFFMTMVTSPWKAAVRSDLTILTRHNSPKGRKERCYSLNRRPHPCRTEPCRAVGFPLGHRTAAGPPVSNTTVWRLKSGHHVKVLTQVSACRSTGSVEAVKGAAVMFLGLLPYGKNVIHPTFSHRASIPPTSGTTRSS